MYVLRFLLFACLSFNVYANGFHLAGGIYLDYIDTESGSKFSILNDVRLGYRFDFSDRSSLAILAASESQEIPNDNQDEKRDSLGLSLAFYLDQFYVMGAYFPHSKIEGGGRLVEIDGNGYRFDFGMNFSIRDNIKVGPRLGYRKFSYDTFNGFDASFSSFEPTFAFNVFF